jgi:hypothetical protein
MPFDPSLPLVPLDPDEPLEPLEPDEPSCPFDPDEPPPMYDTCLPEDDGVKEESDGDGEGEEEVEGGVGLDDGFVWVMGAGIDEEVPFWMLSPSLEEK